MSISMAAEVSPGHSPAVASDLCVRAPVAIAAENPNLQVSYRQGFTIQGAYTQEELEATVRAWPCTVVAQVDGRAYGIARPFLRG